MQIYVESLPSVLMNSGLCGYFFISTRGRGPTMPGRWQQAKGEHKSTDLGLHEAMKSRHHQLKNQKQVKELTAVGLIDRLVKYL